MSVILIATQVTREHSKGYIKGIPGGSALGRDLLGAADDQEEVGGVPIGGCNRWGDARGAVACTSLKNSM
jgi:hypothetical protein